MVFLTSWRRLYTLRCHPEHEASSRQSLFAQRTLETGFSMCCGKGGGGRMVLASDSHSYICQDVPCT